MNLLSRKERLIITAIDIIDELGFQGLTTKEMSKRNNITEAAIYKHFKNKNEILKCVLNYFNDGFSNACNLISNNNLSSLKALEVYIAITLEFYEEHPNMTAILNSFEVLRHEEALSECIADYVNIRIQLLTDLFQNGINNKEFDGILKADSLAYITLGIIISVTLRWRLLNYNFSLTDKIQSIANQIKEKICL